MTLLFLIPWIAILYIASRLKGTLLFYFILFQFVFVGTGLALFPALDPGYIETTFPSFDLSSLSATDYNVASMLVLSGCVSLVCSYALLNQIVLKTPASHALNTVTGSSVRPLFVFLMLTISLSVCIPFIMTNYQGIIPILFATEISDIANSTSLRYSAVSNYSQVLFIYNLLPASTMVALLYALERKRKGLWTIFLLFFLLTAVCLLLTFQKRPLLVFLGSIALLAPLYIHYRDPGHGHDINFSYLVARLRWAIVLLFLCLLMLYFFYTGYRFTDSLGDALQKNANIIMSRILGRLSIPAAMYVDFFPSRHDFYGVDNIGLLGRIFDLETFYASREVFTYYSTGPTDGSVAASVFIDAYGQGGVIMPFFYGILLGFIILLLEYCLRKSGAGAHKAFCAVGSIIFLYYLSQASLFRALLGYGGIFYLVVWLSGFRKTTT
jgi:hypothetical protein